MGIVCIDMLVRLLKVRKLEIIIKSVLILQLNTRYMTDYYSKRIIQNNSYKCNLKFNSEYWEAFIVYATFMNSTPLCGVSCEQQLVSEKPLTRPCQSSSFLTDNSMTYATCVRQRQVVWMLVVRVVGGCGCGVWKSVWKSSLSPIFNFVNWSKVVIKSKMKLNSCQLR